MTQEYIGVDLHKAFFPACAVTAIGERQWEARFPRTADGLARFIARGVGATHAIAVEASGPIKRGDATGRWARRLAVRKGIHKARVALARVLCDDVVATWPRPNAGA